MLLKKYTHAIGMCSVTFLWGIQIPIGPIEGLPLYLFLIPFLILIDGLTIYHFRFSLILGLFLISILTLQLTFQNIHLTTSSRIISSMIMFVILISLVSSWYTTSLKHNHKYFFNISKAFLVIQFFFMIIQLIFYKVGLLDLKHEAYLPGLSIRPPGLFMEPSHVAVGLAPFYYFAINSYNDFISKYGKPILYILILIVFICPSATMLAFISFLSMIWYFRNFRFNIKNMIYSFSILVVCFLVIYNVIFSIQEISDRIISLFSLLGDGLDPSANISALILLKGYEMFTYAITNYPLGIGFLNMALVNEFSSVSFLYPFLYNLNKQDGSSLFFKFCSEFGIFGIIFFLYTLKRLFKNIRSETIKFENAFLFTFIACSIRGPSYFDGPILIVFSMCLFAFFYKTDLFLSKIIITSKKA